MDLSMALISGVVALLFAGYLIVSVLKKSKGTPKMQEISNAIKEGAMTYMHREYKTVAIVAVILAVILGWLINIPTAIGFSVGAFFSALAGYIGMNMSVRSNVRVAEAAKKGLKEALKTAVRGGAVTGMFIVGLGILSVGILYYVYKDPTLIVGAGFGASLISLFARVGGGIYTKAADVGADLVGKIEKGIPEDDPRNPAVIADNVGDNVGDCAGMGADLFETYVVSLIAAMLLGVNVSNGVLLPLIMSAAGIFASIVGIWVIGIGKSKNIWKELSTGVFTTAGIAIVLFYFVIKSMMNSLNLFYASLAGIFLTVGIWITTEYYTSKSKKPVQSIAKASQTGAATNIISGLSVGMESTFVPVILIAISIIWASYFGGVYGVAIATIAMLSVTATIITLDSYGPITDNAGGIAEMAGLSSKIRKVTDELDAVGNTTKAVTKGFAISSAALAALSLFVAFANEAGIASLNIINEKVVIGLFLGGSLPFIFSAILMGAVGRAAYAMVNEVRRQFKTIKGIMSGKAKPDYAKCVDISTKASLKEMILPGVIAVLSPIVVGFIFGVEALGGLLAGSIVTGLLMALFLSNGGAAWDNAKKYIEDGHYGGKGSLAHKAAVVGDTVGDPSKDTAGPALNALIKVLNTISILFAGLIVMYALL
jgi:K(+)-stimulated pyrophosphate-energized sodium pump